MAESKQGAQIFSDLPTSHWGENEFARKLAALLDNRARLWFSYAPSRGREIDVILLLEGVGAFVIELKAIGLDAIEVYTEGACKIRGNGRLGEHPVEQARQGMYGLLNALQRAGVKAPRLTCTAVFPFVKRSDFREKFGVRDGTTLSEHVDGLLFADDLLDESTLEHRLRHIVVNPPKGTGARRVGLEAAEIESFVDATASELVHTFSVTTSQFIVEPGKLRKDSSIGRLLVPGSRGVTLIEGLPGSGKTRGLLEIATAHAKAGRKTLFLCFNKVLGTKLRQEVQGFNLDAEDQLRLTVADFYQIRAPLRELPQLKESLQGAFETVCVDEAQDSYAKHAVTKEYVDLCSFAEEVISPDAEWFMAIGRDQALYGSEPPRVLEAREGGRKPVQLRRADSVFGGYRSSAMAHVGFSYKFDAQNSVKAGNYLYGEVEKRISSPEERLRLSLDYLEISEVHGEERVERYTQIIERELLRVASLGNPGDLMIMTPHGHDRDQEYISVRRALENVGIEYLDQVLEENRRKPSRPGQVRLLTVHSARGLQATRTMLIAPHRFDLLREGSERSSGAVAGGSATARDAVAANIAFSRAMHGTHMVCIRGAALSRVERFVVDTHHVFISKLLGLEGDVEEEAALRPWAEIPVRR
ncbi:NERD domain-containing protein [Micrococcus luteus]|uniref:NERD domain-containing protein n=1 Tax=Micrococcus luteus TaxID=1270 RepID=UPI0022E5149C|nr:NERD domain-containing protein [Micrococcus luteus]